MRENVTVAKTISVKQDEMLLQDGDEHRDLSKNSEPTKHL